MRDRAAERAGLGPLHVDVDPLVVAGRVREGVDPLLGHLEPLGAAEVLAHGVGELVERREDPHACALLGMGGPGWMWPMPEAPNVPSPASCSPGPPRSCCTTTSTAGCGRRRSSSSPPRPGTTLPAQDADGAAAAGSRTSADCGSLERYLETFDHTVAVMQTADEPAPGRPRVRARPGRGRRGLRRGPLRPRAAPGRRAVAGAGRRGGPRRVRRGPGARRAATAARSSCGSCSPPCGTRPAAARSPS